MAGSPPLTSRSDTLLDDGWRFMRADAAGAEAPAFDDAGWEGVSVPHTYNAIDGQDGGGDYYRGVAWYRRRFDAPSDMSGRRAFIGLDAANTRANVYLNGVLLGSHSGGFSAFRFDASAALLPGENVLAVQVDNSDTPDVPPLQADFTFFGGIYRDVHLLVTNDLHLDVLDHGSPGVYLKTTDVSADSANLSARVRVTNSGAAPDTADVVLTVLDDAGTSVATLTASASVPAGETLELPLSGTITSPHLWQGRSDPYLYSARVELSRAGAALDAVTQSLGFRSFAVDPALGFTLNGQAYDLHGVNRHQDRLDRGWAIGKAEHDEDMALIAELGATAIRLAHYQHADYFYELCDRMGMLVWAEIPLVDETTDSAAFTDNARQQLTELIRQSQNHPSIVVWGIGNEQRMSTPPSNALLASLAELVRSEDDTRLSAYAHCCGSDTSPLTSHSDLVGYNYYYGWYMGSYEQVGDWADGLHITEPNRRIALSEYGAGGSIVQHEDPPRQPSPTALFHPEEYQSALHESTWLALAARPFIWGKFIWNMFDFASDGRNEGDTPGRNDKGLVTYDRVTKKDAFYWYKANWSSEPLAYITSRRFVQRTTETVDVKVYSNLDTVTLSVNGAPVGEPRAVTEHRAVWTAVPLVVGDNRIEVSASGGAGQSANDSVTWTRQ
ncbi:MAG TPA: glycoside hydrolase family 2 TIM barrel-domain containing protein [Polyangiaceae bacterium]|nr:glycoside hydrolase family 2 TIM barrel-domain containing protein [Polyangiaceae bacterium]